MASSSADFQGTDRFQVNDHLGSGTSGEVYCVYDTRLRSYVALKTLQRADPATIYRFKNEFRALADVTHPNLAQLYELQADGDRWFFTMELIDGYDFLEYCRGEPQDLQADEVPPSMPPDVDRVREAAHQLALGLTALHRAGKLHCDIKPTNIRVTHDGRVVLLDFGLVQELFPGLGELTIDAELTGTPAYMSPEQAAGQRLNEATDWYSGRGGPLRGTHRPPAVLRRLPSGSVAETGDGSELSPGAAAGTARRPLQAVPQAARPRPREAAAERQDPAHARRGQ